MWRRRLSKLKNDIVAPKPPDTCDPNKDLDAFQKVVNLAEYSEKLRHYPNPFDTCTEDAGLPLQAIRKLDTTNEIGNSKTDFAIGNCSGYLQYKVHDNIGAAREIFHTILKLDPNNITAWACLGKLAIIDQNEEEVQGILAKLEILKENPAALRQAKFEEAFRYARLGTHFILNARICFNQLYQDSDGHKEIVSEVILMELRHIEEQIQQHKHIRENDFKQSLNSILERLYEIVYLAPNEAESYARIIHTLYVAISKPAGREWIAERRDTVPWLDADYSLQLAQSKLKDSNKPTHIYVYRNMINYSRKVQKYQQAVEFTLDAITKFPNNYSMLVLYGTVIREGIVLGQIPRTEDTMKKVLEYLNKAFQLKPSEPTAYSVLGQFYLEITGNDADKGNLHFQKALDLTDQKDLEALSITHMAWSKSLAINKNMDKCIYHIRKSLHTLNKGHNARPRIVHALTETFSELEEKNSQDTMYTMILGYLNMELGHLEDAMQNFHSVHKLETSAQSIIALAECSLAQKNIFMTETWLQKAEEYINVEKEEEQEGEEKQEGVEDSEIDNEDNAQNTTRQNDKSEQDMNKYKAKVTELQKQLQKLKS